MSLGGFFKKITDVARAAGNPGGSAIRAIRGQPIVGNNTFANVADPLNAVKPAPAPNMGGAPAAGAYTPMYQQPTQTGSREQMVAAAIARNAQAQQPRPPMMGAPTPPPQIPPPGAPQVGGMAPRPGMMDPRMMANVMRTM